MSTRRIEVKVCMGSSCFARGNKRTAEALRDHIQKSGLAERVHLCGSLCEGRCQKGPNLTIEGAQYERVTPGSAVDLLTLHAKNPSPDPGQPGAGEA